MQLNLPLDVLNTEDNLRDVLEGMTGESLCMSITDNSTSVLSVKRGNNRVSVRVHRMFLRAGYDVINEIAGFIKSGRGRTPLIRTFINENRCCLKEKERSFRPESERTEGRFYDLRKIFDCLNNEYFGGNITASIGWGKRNSRRLVRKRTLGTFCRNANTIRINPVLDRKTVPLYFIRYVVYHEMLHSAVGEFKENGKRRVHTPEFKRRERLFEDYEKASLWEYRHGI